MKISVIGYSGSGKSTLAGALGRLHGIPVLYLDTVQFTAGWKERDRGEAVNTVKAFMEKSDWVIEGNYTAFVQKERLEQSDSIIFLDFPRINCLARAVKRYLQHKGGTRESMAEGCPEKIDMEFICWILFGQRSKEKKAHFSEIIREYGAKVTVVRNQKELDALKRDRNPQKA